MDRNRRDHADAGDVEHLAGHGGDARHAQAVLSVQINKSDRGDARGLAEMIRVGWFKAVQVKSLNAHERKALLIARHQLVDMRVRIDNQLRGILKTFGLVIGKCGRGQIGQRAQELSKGQPGIDGVVASMVAVRDSLLEQIIVCDDTARRLMTVPGVGPVVALAYISVIDDPKRFTNARDVGAYLGLTPKRYQSGEVDLAGRISKCGDGFARTCLYEAAGIWTVPSCAIGETLWAVSTTLVGQGASRRFQVPSKQKTRRFMMASPSISIAIAHMLAHRSSVQFR